MRRFFGVTIILALMTAMLPAQCSACCAAMARPDPHACCASQQGAMHGVCSMPGAHEALPGQSENSLGTVVTGGSIFAAALVSPSEGSWPQLVSATAPQRLQPPLVLRT